MSSSSNPLLNHVSNPSIDEHRWIIHIRQALDNEDDLDQNPEIPASIFTVPFESVQEFPDFHEVMQCAHLLDLLYCLIIPKVDGSALSEPVKAVMTLPWLILSNLPGMVMIKQVEYLFFSREMSENRNDPCNNSVNNSKPPLMEEIAIPSVTDLTKAGVKFSVTNTTGIFSIKFNIKTGTLSLPAVSLDMNTEVIMRNLVAYEACRSSGPLIFTRYTELMNGIIDTAEDAKTLREHGIVLNRLKCDEDVAELWNGMSKSIRLTKVPFLDKVIEDVNEYYNGRWSVRIQEVLERHGFESWQPGVFFAAAGLLLFLTSLETFCSVIQYVHRK